MNAGKRIATTPRGCRWPTLKRRSNGERCGEGGRLLPGGGSAVVEEAACGSALVEEARRPHTGGRACRDHDIAVAGCGSAGRRWLRRRASAVSNHHISFSTDPVSGLVSVGDTG